MAYPELAALTEMHGLAFATHVGAGTLFVYLGYLAHETDVPVVPWILPLGFAALTLTADWIAAFQYGIRLGYTGIIVAAAGGVLGAGVSVATFQPVPNQSGQTASRFEV